MHDRRCRSTRSPFRRSDGFRVVPCPSAQLLRDLTSAHGAIIAPPLFACTLTVLYCATSTPFPWRFTIVHERGSRNRRNPDSVPRRRAVKWNRLFQLRAVQPVLILAVGFFL